MFKIRCELYRKLMFKITKLLPDSNTNKTKNKHLGMSIFFFAELIA